MDRTERFYKIELLIRNRGGVNFKTLQDALEVSPATLKRDLEYLRYQLGAPIEYDRFLNGYRFGKDTRGHKHELPGLWFSERELYALLMAHRLLADLDDQGVISRHLQPLLERIHEMLGASEADTRALLKRVKIMGAARRPVPSQFFELVGEALLKRRRLQLRYLTRGRGEVSERDVSPQRLVHYRNTWYLDAWCHQSDALRRFALDAVEEAAVLDQSAKAVALKTVEAEFDGAYGIFSGKALRRATLVFDAEVAPWVSQEVWHPDQRGRWLEGGRYELRVPYADDTELLMDVLRHGEHVEAVAPPELRAAVRGRLARAAARYA